MWWDGREMSETALVRTCTLLNFPTTVASPSFADIKSTGMLDNCSKYKTKRGVLKSTCHWRRSTRDLLTDSQWGHFGALHVRRRSESATEQSTKVSFAKRSSFLVSYYVLLVPRKQTRGFGTDEGRI